MASSLSRLIAEPIGQGEADRLLDTLAIDPALDDTDDVISRAKMAMALNAVLFAGLIARVPTAGAYVDTVRAAGARILFDHGALRTIRLAHGPTGELPPGVEAFARILEPLGYRHAATYPLPALKMTGHAWRHADLPATVPQFFISELHVDRFSETFRAAAERVFGTTRDPIDPAAHEALSDFAAAGEASFASAAQALPRLVAAFDCHHATCSIEDYRTLLAESPEAAWIATEGNAFNHATDRVPDVEGLAERLRAEGRPIKDKVEYSTSGRVRQTAFRADPVERKFLDAGATTTLTVPGSFYEFISRDVDAATGSIDLAFDSANAQGIFAMTQTA